MKRNDYICNKFKCGIDDLKHSSEILFSLQRMCTRKSRLWLFGVDPHGFPISIKVQDFKPTFYSSVPNHFDKSDMEESLADWISGINKHFSPDESYDTITHAEYVQKTQFIGFTNNRKDTLIEYTCINPSGIRKCSEYLKNRSYKTYHDSIPLQNHFLHVTKFAYGDWLVIKPKLITYDKATSNEFEYIAYLNNISKYTGKPPTKIPPVLKSYIRIKCVSRDGVVEDKFSYHPDPLRLTDRLFAVCISYVWANDEKSIPFHTDYLSIMEHSEEVMNGFNSVNYLTFNSEEALIMNVRNSIMDWDPEDIFIYDHYFKTLGYIADRAKILELGDFFQLERFERTKVRLALDKEKRTNIVRFQTRNIINIPKIFKKKPFISVNSYDLYTCSTHPGFRNKKSPDFPKKSELLHNNFDVNKWVKNGQYDNILKMIVQDVNLMIKLDRDSGIRIEMANVSKVSNTDLTTVVSSGEQIRVFNTITSYTDSNDVYLNPEKLAQKPLKFPIEKYPPTFSEPEELAFNIAVRDKSYRKVIAMRPDLKKELLKKNPNLYKGETEEERKGYEKYHILNKKIKKTLIKKKNNLADVFKRDSSEGECIEDESGKKEGGNVLKPACGFWGDERICVYDFKSLYPSIMIAFNICYSTIVFDKEYLDLPGVEYYFVAINKWETIAIAKVEGIIPKLLSMLVSARDDIKREMKAETDSFKMSVLDKAQNSMKVICNATYGFCGAGEQEGIMPMKEIMYVVTSLGRILQKQSTDFVGKKYGMTTMYGDTDSIFCLVKVLHLMNMKIEEATQILGKQYHMSKNNTVPSIASGEIEESTDFLKDGEFTWENVCKHYKERKKVPFDPDELSHFHKLNCLVYLISEKICLELTGLFIHPVIMEFENMSTEVWMGWVKKYYCYLFWCELRPFEVKKLKVTGMASKKREWCAWTRHLLNMVTKYCMYKEFDKIEPLLKKEVKRLVSKEVPLDDLIVTKAYKGMENYKSLQSIHVNLVHRTQKRERWNVQASNNDKVRIFLAVVKGKGKLYTRGEDPEIIRQNNMELDYEYYLEKQFYKPMKTLLTWWPELMNYELFYKSNLQKLVESSKQIGNLSDLFSNSMKNKKRKTNNKMSIF